MIEVTFISLQLTLPLRFWVRSISHDTELRMRTLTLNRHEVGILENKNKKSLRWRTFAYPNAYLLKID